MAEVIIIEVDCDPVLYPKVNAILGLDPNTGAGDWPKGLLTHIGGGREGTDGVVEGGEPPAEQAAWHGSTLGPAPRRAGAAPAERIERRRLLRQRHASNR